MSRAERRQPEPRVKVGTTVAGVEVDGVERSGVPRLRRVGCFRGALRSRRCATGCAALAPPDANLAGVRFRRE
jgi:hypothetical protein